MKQYSIIPLNDFLYAVDKDSPYGTILEMDGTSGGTYKGVDWVYAPDNMRIMRAWAPKSSRNCWKIIASNDPSLKDIPQLPEIEGKEITTEEAANLISKHWSPVGLAETAACKIGYKAASKKYSEEDMRNALFTGQLFGKSPDGNPYGKTFEEFADKFLKSLTKQPKFIEVEMELKTTILTEKPIRDSEVVKGTQEYVPKVDKDNKLIVKRWIYEEEA